MKAVVTGRLELNDAQRLTLRTACLGSPYATNMCEQFIINLCGPGSKQWDKVNNIYVSSYLIPAPLYLN